MWDCVENLHTTTLLYVCVCNWGIKTLVSFLYEAKNCEQVLARKDSREQCLIGHLLLLQVQHRQSGPIPGLTSNSAVSGRFYVQHCDRFKLLYSCNPSVLALELSQLSVPRHLLPPCCLLCPESRHCSSNSLQRWSWHRRQFSCRRRLIYYPNN